MTLEHRFFGDSLPNNDVNLTSRYETLTTDNIMLDAVEFVKHIKETVPGAEDSPVIAVGSEFLPILFQVAPVLTNICSLLCSLH